MVQKVQVLPVDRGLQSLMRAREATREDHP